MRKSLFSIAIKLKTKIAEHDKSMLSTQKVLFSRANELKERIIDFKNEKKIANEIENEW
ncbi:MAG: hypothetical protein ABIE14_01605 [Patescibacteria group bacterium]